MSAGKSGAITPGLIGVGVLLAFALKNCDTVIRPFRPLLKSSEVPVEIVRKSDGAAVHMAGAADEALLAPDVSYSSLDDVLEDNSSSVRRSISADNATVAMMAGSSESFKRLPGENLHYGNLDIVVHRNLQDAWFESVENPKLLSLFPSNSKQYKNVYGKPPSISAESKLKKFQADISSDRSLIAADDIHRETMLDLIGDSDGSPVVILAHSEDSGKRIILSDGTSMEVKDVHAQCLEALKRCMVLTCHGDDFDITDKISASEALSIWRAVSKKSAMGENVTVKDLVKEARSVRAKQKTKRKILISWAAASSAGTPFLTYSIQSSDKVDGTGENVAELEESQPED